MTLAYRGGCPRWAERLHFEGEGAVVPPAGLSSLCGVRDVCRGDRPRPDGCTAFLLGLGMGRQGMTLVEVDGVWLQYQCSGRCGFTDARGMFYPDGRTVYDSGGHPDGWRAPYTVGGYESPTPDRFCGSTPLPAPPPDIPTPTAPTPSPSCDVVERVNHWMAPGNKAHGHHPEGDLLRAVIDSTIRSDAGICDTDHAEDWKRCGFRHHDADFRKRRYAFSWKFVGIVEDLGPNTDDDDDTCSTRDGKYPLDSPKCTSSWENSAQRVILAERGACVTVTVCIPDDARTPDGCRITAQGGGCGTRTFRFPEGGDCQ